MVVILGACSGGGVPAHHDHVLRVSTHFGLEPLLPGVRNSMSAHLVELVYVPLTHHFDRRTVRGTHVELTRSAASALAPEALAAAFRQPGLVAARATPTGIE